MRAEETSNDDADDEEPPRVNAVATKCGALVADGTNGPQRQCVLPPGHGGVHKHRVRRRRSRPRAKTISPKKITRESLRAFNTFDYVAELALERPQVRSDCQYGGSNCERPCPWVSCKHHLYLEVNPETGSIKINFPDLEPWELRETCALDVAERGGVTLEEVGEIMNLTRERIRQIEVRGLLAIKRSGALADADAA